MRQSLFVLFLLASLPVAMVHAEPYATYNPATGDIVLSELQGLGYTSLHSKSGLLRISVLSEVPVISPSNAQLPKLGSASTITSHFGIGWQIWNPPSPRVPFDFDSITFSRAVPAGTTVSDLSMWVSTNGRDGYETQILVVPEPATLTLGGFALISLAALRRRK
jgi:hypothetical protein